MNSKTPIFTKADILPFFQQACVPKSELLIGLEVERSAVYTKNFAPVQYAGASGYLAILKKLVEKFGWSVLLQKPDGSIVSLQRGDSEIHVEDDGRLEIVTKPHKKLSALCHEYKTHAQEIETISKEFGIQWLALGRKPFAKNKDIEFAFDDFLVADLKHCRDNFPDFNQAAFVGWEKKNDAVHVNFGYTSEADAIKKFQTFIKISPILMAMFANSPLDDGKFSGFLTKRNHSNSICCPSRMQVQKSFFEEDFCFEKWIDYLLDLPMRLIVRNGENILVPLTFAQYLRDGFGEHRACMDDFFRQVKSAWGEIRMKNYLEYRSFDTVPSSLIPCMPALVQAITRSDTTMDLCQGLTTGWSFDDHMIVRDNVYKEALQATLPNGKKMLCLAKQLLEIASASLKEQCVASNSAEDLSPLLEPIKQYVFVREQSPARYIMEMWNGEWHQDPQKLLDWSGV